MTAYTYATLKTALAQAADEEETGSEFGDALPRLINDALARVSRDLELEIFVTEVTSTLAAGSFAISRPADMVEPMTIYYRTTASASRVPLFKRSYDWLRLCFPNPATTGTTEFWAEDNASQFIVAPAPAATLTYYLRYLARLTLSDSVTSNWISTVMGDMLFDACMVECEAFLKDFAAAQTWDAKYKDKLPDAKSEVSGLTRVATDRMKNTPVLLPKPEVADGD